MPYANAAGVEIYYEAEGEPAGSPVLFIEGFSAQMIGWHPRLIRRFLDLGLRVIRFDNRDVGLSHKFGGPEDLTGGYTLADMAADGFVVLDALGLDRAHVVGQSMGGMIAQSMASAQPHRVASLCLIYTAPWLEGMLPGLGGDRAAALQRVQPRLPRNAAIDAFVESQRVNKSPGYAFDEAWARQLGAMSYDRCYAPDGLPRQYAAMQGARQPFADYPRLAMPTAIIHGRDDAAVHCNASLELARLIPHAEVHLYPGMAHQLAEPLWDDYVAAISRTIERGATA